MGGAKQLHNHIGLISHDGLFALTRSCLDENEAFLTTADSAVTLLSNSTRQVSGWKGIEYKAALPFQKPPGANFYPPDMDKTVVIEILCSFGNH